MRLYFDENFSQHLANGFKAFQQGRLAEDIEVYHLTEEFPRGTKDEIWLPGIAQRHGCILTQDVNIHRTQLLWELCTDNKIGVFFFRPPKKKKYDYWGWATKVFAMWPYIKNAAKDTPRPFAFYIEDSKSKLIAA
jgi:hypothetical protein